MVSLISRAVGAATVLGFALYGFKVAMGNVFGWKQTHDRFIIVRAAEAEKA